MKKDKSGPAFPQPCTENGYAANSEFEVAGGGMTLRDYFAAKAMQSLYLRAGGSPVIDAESCDYFAIHAYEMADAMLKARGE